MRILNAKRRLPPTAIKLFTGILICLAITATAFAKGDGKSRQPCVTCHGLGLRGGPIGPPLAGRSPTGILRQLYAFRLGTRSGANAALMQPIVASLTPPDMLALAAYAGSLPSSEKAAVHKQAR